MPNMICKIIANYLIMRIFIGGYLYCTMWQPHLMCSLQSCSISRKSFSSPKNHLIYNHKISKNFAT